MGTDEEEEREMGPVTGNRHDMRIGYPDTAVGNRRSLNGPC